MTGRLGGWLCILALCVTPGAAQLSPGPLSEPHAGLEGSSHCLECHSAGRGVDPDACLSCHLALRKRVTAGQGLHARPDYGDCKTCHIEHHGRDFELVWWGEEGRDAFDHGLTGWPLRGAHAEVGCGECHEPGKVRGAEALRAQGKDLSRTFLGLGREGCTDCHADPHEGTVGERCESCHSVDGWKPAGGFDHSTTDFPLTGRHRDVSCRECHSDAATEGAPSFQVAGQACRDCHRDPHEARLGTSCGDCHSTAGWRSVELDGFDHDRTRYPLRGRHRSVACEGCHRPGSPRRGLAFGACSDCHADPHGGQLRDRPDGGRCESCHDVQAFVPSSFGMVRHLESDFPLTGAHQAVPCLACHQEALGRLPAAGRGGRFRFADTTCQACHGDPHHGEAARFVEAEGCPACHEVGTWARISFDHARTGFALAGKHAGIDCRSCHPTIDVGAAEERIQMRGLQTECAACHADPHGGQFAGVDGRTACERCHGVDGWERPDFDHERDTAFPLRGAHETVPCAACHPTARDEDGREVLRFRPLPTECAGCHAG